MSEKKPETFAEYGIEKVPREARTYGFTDTFFTWFGAGINTGSWYFGGLAAALGMAFALASSLIWLPLIMLPWLLIGYIGHAHGASTVAASRPSLGTKGANITGLLQTVVLGCWPSVNSFIAAISLTYVFHVALGWPHFGQPGATGPMVLGILLTAVTQGVISVVGHEAIRYLERVSAILLIALGLWMTVVILTHWNLADIFSYRAAVHKTPAQLIDYAFGFGWSWAMIADFARFAKTRRTATWATWLGVNVGQAWFIIIGAIGAIGVALASGHLDPNNSDPSSTLAALGLGLVAFFILVFATVSTNVTNLYGAGIGLINLTGGSRPKRALAFVAVGQLVLCFIPLFFSTFLDYFITFLSFAGGLFVPLWTIILVDYFLVKKQNVDEKAMFSVAAGGYWYRNGWNVSGVISFGLGSAFYFLLMLGVPSVSAVVTASVPTMAATAILYWLINIRSVAFASGK